jgi:predicted GNAT superfamily acetyltransferase
MGFDVQRYDHALLEPVFDLATRVFIEGSTLHRALGTGVEEYRTYLRSEFESMVNEDHSVVALNNETGELSGCLIVTDFYHQALENTIHCSVFAPLRALTSELCQQYSHKTRFQQNEAILVDMAAVAEHARGNGVYQQMRLHAHQMARGKGFKRVVGELTSVTTQNFVLDKLGHEKMAEVMFGDFQFEGKYPFASINVPKSIILTVGEL